MFPSLNGLTVIPKLSNFSFCRQAGEGYSSGGTKYWNAPECATPELKGAEQERSNLPSRDVFSLGLVCWNVLYEDRPFSDIGDEADSSMATRQCIYLAKSEGRLLQKLRVNAADVSVDDSLLQYLFSKLTQSFGFHGCSRMLSI